MKKLFLILLVIVACKNKGIKEDSKEPIILKESEEDFRFVISKTGLVYRDKAKGKRLGEIPYKTEVKILEHTNIFQEIKSGKKKVVGEWLGIELKKKTVYVFDGFLSKDSIKETIWDRFPIKEFPINEAIHPNKKKSDMLDIDEISKLHLDKIYPNFSDEFNPITFYPSCLLEFKNLSEEFKIIVVQVDKGTISESLFIPYKNDEFIMVDNKFKNFLVVASEQKTRGTFDIKSQFENNYIAITKTDYSGNAVEFEKSVYQLDSEGRIYKLKN